MWAQQCGSQYYATGVCSEISPSFQILRSFSPAVQSKATCSKKIQLKNRIKWYQNTWCWGLLIWDFFKNVCAKSKVLWFTHMDWQIVIQYWHEYGLTPLNSEALHQHRLKICICICRLRFCWVRPKYAPLDLARVVSILRLKVHLISTFYFCFRVFLCHRCCGGLWWVKQHLSLGCSAGIFEKICTRLRHRP